MFLINATTRLKVSANWFDSMSEFQKKEYIKEHPDSKYAKGWAPSGDDIEDEDDELDPVQVETLGSKVRSFLVKALGGEPNRVMKNKGGYLSRAWFGNDPDNQREVNLKYSKAMLSSGKKFSPYGYWKDKDHYVYMTKKEWKSLSPGQRKSADDRSAAYGIGPKEGNGSKVNKKSNFGKDSKSVPKLPAPKPKTKGK